MASAKLTVVHRTSGDVDMWTGLGASMTPGRVAVTLERRSGPGRHEGDAPGSLADAIDQVPGQGQLDRLLAVLGVVGALDVEEAGDAVVLALADGVETGDAPVLVDDAVDGPASQMDRLALQAQPQLAAPVGQPVGLLVGDHIHDVGQRALAVADHATPSGQ